MRLDFGGNNGNRGCGREDQGAAGERCGLFNSRSYVTQTGHQMEEEEEAGQGQKAMKSR